MKRLIAVNLHDNRDKESGLKAKRERQRQRDWLTFKGPGIKNVIGFLNLNLRSWKTEEPCLQQSSGKLLATQNSIPNQIINQPWCLMKMFSRHVRSHKIYLHTFSQEANERYVPPKWVRKPRKKHNLGFQHKREGREWQLGSRPREHPSLTGAGTWGLQGRMVLV